MTLFKITRVCLVPLALFAALGCASRYRLEPTVEKPEVLNGVRLGTLVTPKCVVQIGSEFSNSNEMLVRVRLTNKTNAPLDYNPAGLSLSGSPEIVPNSTIVAADPEVYLRDLRSALDLHETRTKMESYQGIEGLDSLTGGKADPSIQAANRQYREKKKDAAKNREKAEAIRKRISAIEPGVLKPGTAKPGETLEGLVIFPASFKDEGPVSFGIALGACTGTIDFLLKN